MTLRPFTHRWIRVSIAAAALTALATDTIQLPHSLPASNDYPTRGEIPAGEYQVRYEDEMSSTLISVSSGQTYHTSLSDKNLALKPSSTDASKDTAEANCTTVVDVKPLPLVSDSKPSSSQSSAETKSATSSTPSLSTSVGAPSANSSPSASDLTNKSTSTSEPRLVGVLPYANYSTSNDSSASNLSPVGEGHRSDFSAARSLASDAPTWTSQGGSSLSSTPFNSIAAASRQIASSASQQEVIDAALQEQSKLQNRAAQDNRAVAANYSNLPPQEQVARAENASRELSHLAQKLQDSQSDLDPSERARFSLLAKTASELAQRRAEEIKNGNIQSLTQPLDPTAPPDSPASTDALYERMVQYYGLTPEERKQIDSELALKETVPLKGPSGKKEKITLLHNGYVLDHDASSTNCSRFVSLLWHDIFEGKDVTTYDLKKTWELIYRGKIDPNSYSHDPKRGELIHRAAQRLRALNSQKGGRPTKGDLIFNRFEGDVAAHVVLVMDYDPKTEKTKIIGASQSRGTIVTDTISFTYPSGAAKPFYILRRKDGAIPQFADKGGRQ